LAGVTTVIHGEHGREWTDAQGTNWKRNQIRRIVGLLVSRYVVVCDFFREWLRHTCKVPGRKIIHIPNGVDTEKFRPLEPNQGAPAARGELRRRLGLPAEGLLLGAVGRLDPVKDFPTLLRGFSRLCCQFPQARLAIVGDGPVRANLMDLARALDLAPRLSWVGAQEDVASLLRCFDLFVQCSIFEGMSNTILEAMATGLPVVASATGGNGELVVDGANGFLFPVGDVEALTQALTKYASDQTLRELHAAQSRQRALEHFDLTLMTSRYASLYEAAFRTEN
jgi:sugar transferase (PEP-CTERM/EpsH1 system associated)